ncbi:hypothetical protein B0I35DRAFT_432847 [Stachybotrys elegans]|uniref:Uncharacterized protein n=1 Tax=Stachybotrys elegans TaxID=80388 RepID=A0A8K0SRX5_9HYPO|nr:hypothetical protein B0I35DRAFT_432847 [Stachybotrys elegans]
MKMMYRPLARTLLRPARATLTRQQHPTTTTTTTTTILSVRRASNVSPDKPASETSKFYKQFSRPVAKVLLMAVLTYQVVYWAWVKLETDEIIAQTEATKAELEAKVAAYGKQEAEKKA